MKFRRLRYVRTVRYGTVRYVNAVRLSVVNGAFINRLEGYNFSSERVLLPSSFSISFSLSFSFFHGGRGGTKEGRKGVSRGGKYTHMRLRFTGARLAAARG